MSWVLRKGSGEYMIPAAYCADEQKAKEIGPVIEDCYSTHFSTNNDLTLSEFYRAICETIEEINKKLGTTQFRVPKTETLQQAFEKHHKGKAKSLTKEEFQKILQEVIFETGFTGLGAKDLLFYIFGVPATTLFIKQRIMPNVVPNEFFIPLVTSATVFVLAKFNKL